MIFDLIVLFVFITVLYLFSTSENQFAATASAIRQIWSGSCRLSCQRSEYSGFSGLSGLVPGYEQQMPPRGSNAGTSRDCACESCPCELIENFLRSCRPASNIYGQVIECTQNCIVYVVQMLLEVYSNILRILQCNASCQVEREIELTPNENNNNITSDNFKFKKEEKEKRFNNFKKVFNKQKIKSGSDESLKQQQGTSKTDEPSQDLVAAKFCSKCVEKGKTCVKECPKAHPPKTPSKQKIDNEEKLPQDSPTDLTKQRKASIQSKKASSVNLKKLTSKESLAENTCSKCIEKGKVCLKECPTAAAKKRNDKSPKNSSTDITKTQRNSKTGDLKRDSKTATRKDSKIKASVENVKTAGGSNESIARKMCSQCAEIGKNCLLECPKAHAKITISSQKLNSKEILQVVKNIGDLKKDSSTNLDKTSIENVKPLCNQNPKAAENISTKCCSNEIICIKDCPAAQAMKKKSKNKIHSKEKLSKGSSKELTKQKQGSSQIGDLKRLSVSNLKKKFSSKELVAPKKCTKCAKKGKVCLKECLVKKRQ